MVKVAVIIPIYNIQKELLDKCFLSIIKQTYKNFIMILVDDGSDRTETINAIQNYNIFDNVVVICKENGGAPSARNYGIEWDVKNYKSDLTCFVDGDDYLSPDFLEKLVSAYISTNADIVVSNYDRFIEYPNDIFIIDDNGKDEYKISDNYEGLVNLAFVKYPPIVMGKLFRSSLFDNCRFKSNMKFGDDTSLLYRVFALSKLNCHIDYVGYHLNRVNNQESICRTKHLSNKQIISAIEANYDIASLDLPLLNVYRKNEIKVIMNNVAVDAFLELVPRFSKRIASSLDYQMFRWYVSWFVNEKRVNSFRPYNKKTKYKKLAFIYLRPFYCFLYRLYIKHSNKRYGVAIK